MARALGEALPGPSAFPGPQGCSVPERQLSLPPSRAGRRAGVHSGSTAGHWSLALSSESEAGGLSCLRSGLGASRLQHPGISPHLNSKAGLSLLICSTPSKGKTGLNQRCPLEAPETHVTSSGHLFQAHTGSQVGPDACAGQSSPRGQALPGLEHTLLHWPLPPSAWLCSPPAPEPPFSL